MAKNFFIGVNGAARKVKKAYIGVAGIARAVKKGFIGVANLARQFFSAIVMPIYDGAASPLSASVMNPTSARTPSFLLFAGGRSSITVASNSVTAYKGNMSKSFTTINPARGDAQGASVGNYALIAGGVTFSGSTISPSAYVDAFTDTLVREGASPLSRALANHGAASIGDYAVFAGGATTNDAVRAEVTAYSSTLAKTYPTSLSLARTFGIANTGASFTGGGRAIFAGGRSGAGITAVVDMYDSNLNQSTGASLSVARFATVSAVLDDYAFFAGGYSTSYVTLDTVDVYSKSLVRQAASNLLAKVYAHAGASLGDCVIFAGGETDAGTRAPSAIVTLYDKNLVRYPSSNLSAARGYSAAGQIGGYALFAGGDIGTGYSSAMTNAVDKFKI